MPRKPIGESDVERIMSTVSDLVDEYHLPGISVGVVSGQDLVFAEGFGFADIESRRPQDPALRQRIGSITKTMVGLCAMALMDEGKLSLDDLVVEQLPDLTFHGPAGTLAVRHLLTHTGGIGEAPTMDDVTDPFAVLWSDTADVPPVGSAYPDGILIETAPGTKWAYANHGFALLGEIVARIEGKPIEGVLHNRVFGPLGMTDTDCLDLPHERLTTGYQRPPGHDELDVLELLGKDLPATYQAMPKDPKPVDGYNIRGRYVYVRPRAAGGVQSTIFDMARYAAALLRKGEGIVRSSTFDAMTAPQYRPDDRLMSVGLTFFRQRRFGSEGFGHGGGIAGGWNTHLGVFPDEQLAVLVHMNLSDGLFSRVAGRIVQAALDAPDTALPAHGLAPAVLESAPGVFQPAPGHLTNFRTVRATGRVQITAEGGELFLRSRRGAWREGVRMLPASDADPGLFMLDTGDLEPPQVVLVRDEREEVTSIRFDRLVHLFRNDSLEPWV
ncbi:MAG: serine hydrolase domain-containing protein [SAR202 cluster bacterium]|jgi:CubicO group peptidase (beta-lactamase class C family)|nr:serine hydrolase domain-containing protein [SAR202 cluster bacterium]